MPERPPDLMQALQDSFKGAKRRLPEQPLFNPPLSVCMRAFDEDGDILPVALVLMAEDLEAENANLREQALVSRQQEHEIRLLTAIAKEARAVADKIGVNYRPNTAEGRMIAALADAHDEGINP